MFKLELDNEFSSLNSFYYCCCCMLPGYPFAIVIKPTETRKNYVLCIMCKRERAEVLHSFFLLFQKIIMKGLNLNLKHYKNEYPMLYVL